jgi:enoyl-CoA hydratase/carnithine racemase
MSETVRMNVDEGVALLTLNRPDRLNAWTPELGSAYFDHLEACGADPDVRVIVVTGEGRGFCAGADMQDLQAIGGGEIDQAERRQDQRPQSFPTSIPKPVIAAINGPVAGIGLALALWCDIRFIADDAKVTTAFARRGLIGEYGMAWILPRLTGPAAAMDLLFSGRVVLGQEAAAMGLANRSVPGERLLDETLGYARELARWSSPASMAVMKQQVYADLERDLSTGYGEAIRLMLESFERPDFAEGVAAFVEKREPSFDGVSRPAGEPVPQ